MVHEKALEGFEISAYDTQQVIGISGHQIAFEHFRPAENGLFEAFKRLLALMVSNAIFGT
jgi:hypothetical protein